MREGVRNGGITEIYRIRERERERRRRKKERERTSDARSLVVLFLGAKSAGLLVDLSLQQRRAVDGIRRGARRDQRGLKRI